MRYIRNIFILWLSIWSMAFAGTEEPGVAFLKISGLAHSAPFGFAAATLVGHPDAIFWNPAGLAADIGGAAVFSGGSWLQQIQFGAISAALPLARRHHLGFSAYYMNVPGIERRYSATDHVPLELLDAANQSFVLAYGVALSRQFNAGASLKMLRQDIDKTSGAGFSADAGLLYRSSADHLILAATLKNIGPGFRLASTTVPLPHLLDIAARMRLRGSLDVLAAVRNNLRNDTQAQVAGEWRLPFQEDALENQIAIRLGYRFTDDISMQKGISAGLGIDKNIGALLYSFDYAYTPFNTLGVTHLCAISMRRLHAAKAVVNADRLVFSPLLGTVDFTLHTQHIANPGRWQLLITDAHGLLKRTFSGEGLPPQLCTWQGTDLEGRILPDGYYNYRLLVMDGQGRPIISPEKKIQLDGRPPDIRLQLVPRFFTLHDSIDLHFSPSLVKTLETDFLNPVTGWEIKVLDRKRQNIKTFCGEAEPPAKVLWSLAKQSVPELPPATYYAVASARDIVGNIGYSDTLCFIVGYELEPEVKKSIQENSHGFKIILGSVLFDFDKATLRPPALPVLRNVALILETLHEATALIGGHTDAMGSDVYNLELSHRRTESVRNYLCETLGVAALRLQVKWFGKSQPISDNDTESGRQLNRRVEIEIFQNPQAGR